jgi:hypothetical protein
LQFQNDFKVFRWIDPLRAPNVATSAQRRNGQSMTVSGKTLDLHRA